MTKRYHRDGLIYGHIVDWQVRSDQLINANDLLASVWRQLAQWNVQRVSAWAVGDLHFQQLLGSAGIRPAGRATNFCDYDLTADDQRLSHPPAAPDYAGWRVVMAIATYTELSPHFENRVFIMFRTVGPSDQAAGRSDRRCGAVGAQRAADIAVRLDRQARFAGSRVFHPGTARLARQ